MTTNDRAWEIMGGIQDMVDDELRLSLPAEDSRTQIERVAGGVLLKIFIPTDD